MLDLQTLMINRLEFLRGEEKLRLAAEVRDGLDLERCALADICAVVGRDSRSRAWQPDEIRRLAEGDMRWLQRGGQACRYGQAAYPADLAAIDDPPFVLFHRGGLPDDGMLLLAAVGTRRPSERGRQAAWDSGRQCAELGVGLVSGLAHGIDGAAHAGCLVYGGYTLAVLGGGIDQVHPRLHRRLADGILERGGCLASEYGPGTEMRKYRFPARNRIISGLCRLVLVVEAPERSGALITAQFALEQGREVYVHAAAGPGPVGAGCAALAESGARTVGHVGEMEIYGRSIAARVRDLFD